MREHSNFNFSGMYRAKVIENKDPDKFAKVKVEILISKETELTAWAMAANNPIGGRDADSPELMFGSVWIPPVGSLVYIFFEGGNINRPRYFAGLDIEYAELPPENLVGTEYQDKITMYRSPDGRTIVVSDDPDDARMEITGKKRETYDKENPEDNVYKIKDHQSTILIDEREGKEKILIKDYKGNYIKLNTEENWIEIESLSEMRVKAGGNISVHVDGDANVQVTGDSKVMCEKNTHITTKEETFIKTEKNTHIKTGENTYIQSGQNTNIKTEQDTNIESSGKVNIKSGGEMKVTANSAMHIKAADKVNVHSDANINLDAQSDVTIQGINSTIKASGNVNVESSGSTTVKASGTVDVDGAMVNLNCGMAGPVMSVNDPAMPADPAVEATDATEPTIEEPEGKRDDDYE